MVKRWVAKKKTINLSERTVEALLFLSEKTSKTDTQIINDAVQDVAAKLGWDR